MKIMERSTCLEKLKRLKETPDISEDMTFVGKNILPQAISII